MMSESKKASGGALIASGQVRHSRLRPVAHHFAYRTYFLVLPMRRLRAEPDPALQRNRFGLISFFDADHGDGRTDSLAWLDALLAAEGIADADGEVWLHCYPRVLGYAFKPVSFWHCERSDGSLAAIVAEVNNTFGERHCYLLAGPDLAPGRELRATKVLHVSPFCSVAGDYRFRFLSHGARSVARVELHDEFGPLIRTSLSGTQAPLTAASARAAFFGTPLMTFAVVARIHWQALRLWLKRVPFHRKPEPPTQFTTR